ncbi:MAG: hypothetical protein WBD24_03060 [Candidatus Omnitrophota bacterium]
MAEFIPSDVKMPQVVPAIITDGMNEGCVDHRCEFIPSDVKMPQVVPAIITDGMNERIIRRRRC